MKIGLLDFINDACRAMPTGYELIVIFRSGEMGVQLTDFDDESLEINSPVEHPGDAGILQDAINTARSNSGLHRFYHESLIDRSVLNEPT